MDEYHIEYLIPEESQPWENAYVKGATKSRIQRARQLLKAEFITCCSFETDKKGKIISFGIKNRCKPLQKIKQEIQL